MVHPALDPHAVVELVVAPDVADHLAVELRLDLARDAPADLLEQIAACGSLSEAARRLRFSYRRAWLLTDAMNKRWAGPLVTTATGGKRGGGTNVTELGLALLRAYRDLQVQLEALLGENAAAFERATRGG